MGLFLSLSLLFLSVLATPPPLASPQYPDVKFTIPGRNDGGTIELTGNNGQINKAKAEILKLVKDKNKNKNKNALDNPEGGQKNKKAKKDKNDSSTKEGKQGMDVGVQPGEEQQQVVELTKLQLMPATAARHYRASRMPPPHTHLRTPVILAVSAFEQGGGYSSPP